LQKFHTNFTTNNTANITANNLQICFRNFWKEQKKERQELEKASQGIFRITTCFNAYRRRRGKSKRKHLKVYLGSLFALVRTEEKDVRAGESISRYI
jgi:hypothetical protein